MSSLKFGLSAPFQCGYLPEQSEQLLVYADEEPISAELYTVLQAQGFRRSEHFVYRPHCGECKQCQPIRVEVDKVKLSRSQKRVRNKNDHLLVRLTERQGDYYPLYQKYVNTIHKDGIMYPATTEQLSSFSQCSWLPQYFIEVYDQDKLIAVAICDITLDGLSAVYSFYDPDYQSQSLGTFLIIKQIEIATLLRKEFLYLGYFIKDCTKMNYKNKFTPYQIFQNGFWANKP